MIITSHINGHINSNNSGINSQISEDNNKKPRY